VTTNRLEAFSDGVFAIAITLLVIELRPPDVEHGDELASALWDLWPAYAAYLVSFAVIGVMWLNHHRIFVQVVEVDGLLLVLNLLLLLWVAVIPFPTAVVAEHFGEGGDAARTALALYGGVILVAAITFSGLFAWITHDARLLHRLPPPDVRRAARVRFTIGIAAYAVAFLLSFVSAPLALGLHGAMALYYAFDQATVPGGEA
jgi:uncharacterized membrane protein